MGGCDAMKDADYLLDPRRSADLGSAGGGDYSAAIAIEADGSEHLVLVHRADLGDDSARYDARCPDIPHEQLGPLPLETVKRIAIARRNNQHPKEKK